MTAAEILKECRRLMELSQRELAEAAGVAQSTVARIESGAMDPRVSTLNRILDACHQELSARVVRDFGIDPTLIDTSLKLTPDRRLLTAEAWGDFVVKTRGTFVPRA